ncbi:hypothetical protein EV207_11946 [Scopulibacillus darangshiensis]|uniref:Sensory transduction regulator n=1 Tax=Scopulibacillus darangshiensis TaxID=442528 RepID=A0A4R2NYW8_9BACL|nr:hypothetical protein [Scopulibacillus darangshiensis]TCP26615.1 hypothetical protein EV207_11946 [Scopulibacillus darangshiensis]
MFDPTVFENLKVVLEGAVYELDLSEVIAITNRTNIIDLAKMNRAYGLSFVRENGTAEASLLIEASTQTLSAEILEEDSKNAACDFSITFHLHIQHPKNDCEAILFLINKYWRPYRPAVTQNLSQTYGDDQHLFKNDVTLLFKEGIDESNIDDIQMLLTAVLATLDGLDHNFPPKKQPK